MGGRISFSGLSSGIDFQSIVDTIVAFESRRIDLVRAQQAETTSRLTAIQSLEAFLTSLQTQAGLLADPGDFDVQQAVSSNPTAVTASLTGTANIATQSITVNALAQAAQVASQGIAAIDATIGTGTVDITVGGETTVVDIDTTNNTLQGLADAINASAAPVTAGVINDGSQSNPFRLLITGENTGAANTLSVAVNLTGGTQTPNFTDKLIDAAEAAPTNNAAYTGVAQSSGTYTGTGNDQFLVEILSGGAVGVATFRFSTDGGLTFNDNGGAGFTTSTSPVALEDGVNISFTDSGTLTAGDRFTIDLFDPNVQSAQDASVTLGSTAGGGAPITISSASNTIADLIPGVTLTLNEVTTGPVQISVTADNDAIVDTITAFVESYNALLDFLDSQLDFDTETETAGLLIGDSLLVSIQNRVRRIATGSVAGLTGGINRLSAIGITSNIETGRLEIDTTTLQQVVSANPDAVAALFSSSNTSTNAGISVLSSTASTRTGTAFAVNITQAATQGTFTGSALSGFPITLTAADNEVVLIVDGQESGAITLTEGTYNSAEELAIELQARVNEDPTLGARDITVSVAGGALVLTSRSFGSDSEVRLGSAPANSAFDVLGLTGGTAIAGTDVAGTINGEAAIGDGQVLTANEGNATTEGLALLVTLGPSEVDPAVVEGEVTVTNGIARQLRDELERLTDPVDGRLTRREDTLNDLLEDLAEQIAEQEARLEDRRLDLLDQFARLEASLAEITSQGEQLIAQLQNLPRIDTLTQSNNDD